MLCLLPLPKNDLVDYILEAWFLQFLEQIGFFFPQNYFFGEIEEMKSSKSSHFEHSIPKKLCFHFLLHGMNIGNEVSCFSLYFSTKDLKISECFILVTKKHYPSKMRIIINDDKEISFSTNTCGLGGTK